MTLPTAARRRNLKILCAVSIALFCAVDTARFLRALDRKTPTLKRWLPQAAELAQDDRLYDRHPDYLYPPFFLVLLRPLTHLPLWAAGILWQLLKYAALAVTFAAAWSLIEKAAPFPLWARLVSLVVCARYIVSDLAHGNVNLFIAAAITSAVWLLHERRDVAAGLLVTVAACVKVTPALWALWLIYKRRWRSAVCLLAGALLCLEIIPLAVMPASRNHALLARWFDHVIGRFAATGIVASQSMNQSLPAITNRLLGRAELAEGESPPTLLDLSDGAVRWIQRVAALALLAALAVACRGALPRDPLVLAIEWSLVAPVTLALSGLTWTPHFCVLVSAVVALLAIAAHPQYRTRSVTALTIAAFTLVLFTTDVITPAGRQCAATLGLPLLAALLMGVALFTARAQRRRRDRSSPSQV